VKKEKAVEEVTTLGKMVADGEEYFAVAHIFASFNDTFVVSLEPLIHSSTRLSVIVSALTVMPHLF
jgi:hypothetical protein